MVNLAAGGATKVAVERQESGVKTIFSRTGLRMSHL
jgi:hypothetical protein